MKTLPSPSKHLLPTIILGRKVIRLAKTLRMLNRPDLLLRSSIYLSIYLFIFSLFIYFWEEERVTESEREKESWGRVEREGERTPSGLYTVSTEPYTGLELANCEIMTWAETKSWTFNRLSYPGAPGEQNFLKMIFGINVFLWLQDSKSAVPVFLPPSCLSLSLFLFLTLWNRTVTF